MKSPAFQWYPADYLASARVQMLTLEQEGIYRRLLDYCWLHGSIPAEPERLKLLVGKPCTNGAIEMVATMFQAAGSNMLVHDRLDAERRKQAQWRAKSAIGGKKGAKTRAELRAQIAANQPPKQGCNQNGINQKATLHLQSSSSSSDQNTESTAGAVDRAEPARAPTPPEALGDAQPLELVMGTDPASDPVDMVFPTVGSVKEWPLRRSKIGEWRAAYPAVDVAAVLRELRQWCVDNSSRRKTAGGMLKFLSGRLAVRQNRADGGSTTPVRGASWR